MCDFISLTVVDRVISSNESLVGKCQIAVSKMRPDPHKAKASLKWKLKHGIPLKPKTPDAVDHRESSSTPSRHFHRRQLGNNHDRYDQQEKDEVDGNN